LSCQAVKPFPLAATKLRQQQPPTTSGQSGTKTPSPKKEKQNLPIIPVFRSGVRRRLHLQTLPNRGNNTEKEPSLHENVTTLITTPPSTSLPPARARLSCWPSASPVEWMLSIQSTESSSIRKTDEDAMLQQPNSLAFV